MPDARKSQQDTGILLSYALAQAPDGPLWYPGSWTMWNFDMIQYGSSYLTPWTLHLLKKTKPTMHVTAGRRKMLSEN